MDGVAARKGRSWLGCRDITCRVNGNNTQVTKGGAAGEGRPRHEEGDRQDASGKDAIAVEGAKQEAREQ